jgi:hypothetical protein
MNKDKTSVDTLTSHVPEGKKDLLKREKDPETLESFLQSQIAY